MSTPAIAPAVAARHMPAERLFHPVELGRYGLPHRMVMAPLTRSRARQPGNVPSSQRLLLRATSFGRSHRERSNPSISTGTGHAWTPDIHSPEQVEGWRAVTDGTRPAA